MHSHAERGNDHQGAWGKRASTDGPGYCVPIVPTLRVVTQRSTLCVALDAERPAMHSHAERGNDHYHDHHDHQVRLG